MKIEVSAETYQVWARFEALIKAYLHYQKSLRIFFISSLPAMLCDDITMWIELNILKQTLS